MGNSDGEERRCAGIGVLGGGTLQINLAEDIDNIVAS